MSCRSRKVMIFYCLWKFILTLLLGFIGFYWVVIGFSWVCSTRLCMFDMFDALFVSGCECSHWGQVDPQRRRKFNTSAPQLLGLTPWTCRTCFPYHDLSKLKLAFLRHKKQWSTRDENNINSCEKLAESIQKHHKLLNSTGKFCQKWKLRRKCLFQPADSLHGLNPWGSTNLPKRDPPNDCLMIAGQ